MNYKLTFSILLVLLLTSLVNADIYKDKKDLQKYFKEPLKVYKTSKNCDKVNFDTNLWKSRKIILKTYDYPTLNKLGYCGVIYIK